MGFILVVLESLNTIKINSFFWNREYTNERFKNVIEMIVDTAEGGIADVHA